MAQITMNEGGKGEQTAGIWVSCSDNSCVGLVAQEGVGPYLCIYPPKPSGLPALAIGITDNGVAMIQVPNEADGRKPQVITLSDLVIALRKLASLE